MLYRPLGSTGFTTSAFGLGGESALYLRGDTAQRIIERAFDLGINYFDTAPVYDDSELNLGDVLPQVRNRVFIATKIEERGYDGAWRQFEQSLQRLRTTYVDLLQIHNLSEQEELDEISEDNGALQMLHEAKEQGLVRFTGVTGHAEPEVLREAIARYPFDGILMALNPAEVHVHSFQAALLPEAAAKGMAVMAMKVLARGLIWEKAGLKPNLAIHYVLSLPVSNAVLGVMNVEQLERNVETFEQFEKLGPMPEDGMKSLEEDTRAFAQDLNFYRKGNEHLPFPVPPDMTIDAL